MKVINEPARIDEVVVLTCLKPLSRIRRPTQSNILHSLCIALNTNTLIHERRILNQRCHIITYCLWKGAYVIIKHQTMEATKYRPEHYYSWYRKQTSGHLHAQFPLNSRKKPPVSTNRRLDKSLNRSVHWHVKFSL